MNEIKISAVIITFNEEKNIARCVESVLPVADEVVVLDSFSTDGTKQICERYGVRFFQNKFDGHVEQKNRALDLAANDVVLSLDADEALTDDLKESVIAIKTNFAHDGYTLNRLTNYCGSWIRHCGWYPDSRIRLWHRNKGRWGGVNPHDRVVLVPGAKTGHLKGDLWHYSFHSLSDHLKQLDQFTSIAAKEAFKKDKKVYPMIHIVFYPFVTFLRMYFLRLGFLDGLPGFLVCISGSYYRFMKYAKLHHLKRDAKDT